VSIPSKEKGTFFRYKQLKTFIVSIFYDGQVVIRKGFGIYQHTRSVNEGGERKNNFEIEKGRKAVNAKLKEDNNPRAHYVFRWFGNNSRERRDKFGQL
jgi:hypothetical protein